MADNARDAREPSAEESEWAGFSESADDDDMDFEVGVCLGLMEVVFGRWDEERERWKLARIER